MSATMEDHVLALEASSEHLVISRPSFYHRLWGLVTHCLLRTWLEAPHYGLVNHLLTHLSLATTIAGATLSSHPQAVFVEKLDPELEAPEKRSRRSPDFAALLSYLGIPNPMGGPSHRPRLAFWWEVKPAWHLHHARDVGASFQPMAQLIDQAKYAFAHYGGERYYAFYSIGLQVYCVLFTNRAPSQEPHTLPEAEELPPSIGPRKRPRPEQGNPHPRLSQDLVPSPDVQMIFMNQRLLVGPDDNLELNPYILSALRSAASDLDVTFQRSFLDPPQGLLIPVEMMADAQDTYTASIAVSNKLDDGVDDDNDPSSEEERPLKPGTAAHSESAAYRSRKPNRTVVYPTRSRTPSVSESSLREGSSGRDLSSERNARSDSEDRASLDGIYPPPSTSSSRSSVPAAGPSTQRRSRRSSSASSRSRRVHDDFEALEGRVDGRKTRPLPSRNLRPAAARAAAARNEWSEVPFASEPVSSAALRRKDRKA
ncbi:hypothetical protein FA95DRAFT_1559217 [Auriscalpium vulgare]|uniref:Uncharacterized protein n=1 Tax=Auriscalpium vulgare TaxID=40419 RepID=A0ACB8RTX8_9AGAM|nr:hypothetical protein FA95DRAFT_1559217 [Auriscalpium vulgare]